MLVIIRVETCVMKLKSSKHATRICLHSIFSPNFVKLSSSVNAFKANLCEHKSQQLTSEHYVSSVGNFWEVSERVLQRIIIINNN